MADGDKPENAVLVRGDSSESRAGFLSAPVENLVRRTAAMMDRSIPAELLLDPELGRRARLVTRFGWLGALFGMVYALFYWLINYEGGAAVVGLCSMAFAVAPFLLRRKSMSLAGNFLCFILTFGFTALCFLEGGLQGHAIAWLVSVPLCALLLVGQVPARWWAVVSFLAASVMAGLDIAGIKLDLAYDARWNSIVSAAGYLGLILFMVMLGVIFESGRARAFAKMQEALSELAASNERLVYLNNEKNEFMGIAAHDLKNPLTVVVGSADLLTRTNDPEMVTRLAGNIGKAAKRMRDLIMNLLDANAIEQGKFMSNLERCDIHALVEESLEHNRSSATRKEIKIRVGHSKGLWAKADKAATLQILDNLISNAVKYSPPNTTVHVHTLPEVDYVLMTVRDEGPGISEEDQKKLFQKFTRLTARPTGGESSTGLGLSIVKKLAEAMSGSVQCQSVMGFGSTFTLRLPIATAALQPAMPTAQPANPPANKPRVPSALAKPLPREHARN